MNKTKKRRIWFRSLIATTIICVVGAIYAHNYYRSDKPLFVEHQWGDEIDSFNGVSVYYNGGVRTVNGRNQTDDGYNIGLKYQCVEFVKRYYLEHYNHRFPNSWGNAVDMYNKEIKNGKMNIDRGLLQFKNGEGEKPSVGDLIVFDGTMGNTFGHVAIISKVTSDEIEIIQQNPGPYSNSRVEYDLLENNKIDNDRVLGFLRMK